MKVYNFQSRFSEQPVVKSLRKRFKKLPWKTIGKWAFRVSALGVLFVAFLFIYYSRQLPDPNRLLGRNVAESTKIYAKDGSELYEIHGEIKRELVNLDKVSQDLKDATVAIEDKNFYKHGGISITGLARSVIIDIIYREKRQGGSTITQQFVKNAMLTRDKAYTRKVKEIILSIEMEARFSKDDILKLYLNEIPYGRNAYGIQAAAKTYFNKNASEITLAESAYLAALPQAPSYYNPSGPHFDALEGRQKHILSEMKAQGYITEEEYQNALNEKVVFQQIKTAIKAPHFVQYVQDYLAEKYGEKTLQEGGLKVYTTLDPRLQEIAERAVKEGAAKNERYDAWNAALVAIDPKTGQILAMVGSKDYFGDPQPAGCTPGKDCKFEPNVNVATTPQQPGSSFKPYVYVTAFGPEFKYAPASMLVDVVTDFGNYTPQNFNFSQNGPMSMRKALAGSLNIPAVKTLALVGVDNAIETARNLGITSEFKDCGLSLVLGGCDVKLVDHTAAYATLANGGKRNDKTAILRVISKDGNTLEEFQERSQQVLDPQAVYELVSIMTDNNARSYVFGTNSALVLPGRPAAAKTGTTQKIQDGWTMGFTPSLAAGVWTGNNRNQPMKRDAVQLAGPIWNTFMKEALKDTPVEQFQKPHGIKDVTVDSVSGKLPTQYSPETKAEVFADYAVPTEQDNVHVPVRIDTATGQPATELTPLDRIQEVIYKVIHSEKPNNPNWENPVVAWALANGYNYPPGSGVTPPSGNGPRISLSAPLDNAVIAKLPFQVSVTSDATNIARVDIAIDGELVQSLTSSPYTTTINQKFNDGEHTISAKAVDANGGVSTTSVRVRFAIDNPLVMSEPTNGARISDTTDLVAESPFQYNTVTFYYQSGGQTKTIGVATPAQLGELYTYSIPWVILPDPGTYQVYARSNTGIMTNKINITVE